ncbi:hypothetical protein H4R33_004119 [Dimargaris cristalligena]|nr:hypothetical protein H4R33_004119 [Dimargaris cristalligena]
MSSYAMSFSATIGKRKGDCLGAVFHSNLRGPATSPTSQDPKPSALVTKALKQRTLDLLMHGQALSTVRAGRPSEQPPTDAVTGQRVFARGKKGMPSLPALFTCLGCHHRSPTALPFTLCQHCDIKTCPQCVATCDGCQLQFCRTCTLIE